MRDGEVSSPEERTKQGALKSPLKSYPLPTDRDKLGGVGLTPEQSPHAHQICQSRQTAPNSFNTRKAITPTGEKAA